MAIQNRRGIYQDFDPEKLLPGEWAVVVGGDEKSADGTSVYISMGTGKVKRMATYEDMTSNLNQASAEVRAQMVSDIKAASASATTAATAASAAADRANAAAQLCESNAVGIEDLTAQVAQIKAVLKKTLEINA